MIVLWYQDNDILQTVFQKFLNNLILTEALQVFLPKLEQNHCLYQDKKDLNAYTVSQFLSDNLS